MITLLASLLLAAPGTVPERVEVVVDHTTVVTLSAPVSKVTVDEPTIVEVKASGRKLTFKGLVKGNAEVTVKMPDGEYKIHVYVPADKFGLSH